MFRNGGFVFRKTVVRTGMVYCVEMLKLAFIVISASKHIVQYLFVIKPTRCTNFTNLFCHETLHVSDSSSVHHQEFTHCTLSNGLYHTGLYTAFEQDQDGTPAFHPGHAIAECTVNKLLMMDRRTVRNM